MNEPQAGWYPDPEEPERGRARYWDGARWTERYRTPGREPADIGLAALGLLLMVSAAIVAALNYDAEEAANTARVVGYGFGALLGTLAIASVMRGIYVLIRRGREFVSPWLFVTAGILGWLAVLGQASSSA